VTQSAPNAWLSAVRWGTAVMWTIPSDNDPLVINNALIEKRSGNGQNHTEFAGPHAVAGSCRRAHQFQRENKERGGSQISEFDDV
jgi:hypothetical protein